jgi:hypothetical protein
MNELTFGDTPAAMYLARRCMAHRSSNLNRAVGRRITGTFEHVNDLVNAYSEGKLSAKTFANTLRLMREDVSKAETKVVGLGDFEFEFNLCKNVQIGSIKRAMSLAERARKVERKLEKIKVVPQPLKYSDHVKPMAEILHARSLARFQRLVKPHTL